MGPPVAQTDADREFLRRLFPLFKELPPDFQFPLLNPNYVPPNNTLYCFVSGAIFCCITAAVVSLRLWIRSRGRFGMDDWVMLLAFIFYCAFNVVNVVAVFDSGFGYHLYDLSVRDIRAYFILEYLHVTFLFITLHLCRCSILHLFLRLSHLQSAGQRLYLRTVLGLSYMLCVVCVLFEMLECKGRPELNFDIKSQFDDSCLGLESLLSYGILIAGHIILDALTIFPPLVVLARLPLASGKKFNLIFLLVLGVFTMVFSAIRLYVFYRIMLESFDIPWTAAGVAFWGMLESSLAAIIVCLPALNQTLVKWYKRFWYGTGDEPKSGIISTLARGISIFERTNHTQRGQVKFLSYSAGETVVGADYVELGDVNSKAASTTAVAVEDQKNQQHEQHEGRPTFTNITNTSYPDISITVERSFYISEETTSDEEASRNQSTASIAAPGRAQLPGRRPSSPTISYAAREGMVRPARETQANDKK